MENDALTSSMAANSDHPLLATLPPKSDYLTYLTIIEYNLSEKDLPLLNEILQDETLTTNIGWDLVILLLPFLPASEECLKTIAKLGNPREVLLKVTEALRCIEFSSDVDDDGSKDGSSSTATEQDQDMKPLDARGAKSHTQFSVLLAMLSTLHRRIKTRYPSRFIATTLQGALAAYSSSENERHPMIKAVEQFVRDVWSHGRPSLPPRSSTEHAPQIQTSDGANDPEAYLDPPSLEENRMVNRLLQSFVTHIAEAYMIAVSSSTEIPGLAWSQRMFEELSPAKLVPGRTTVKEKFEADFSLRERELCVATLVKLVRDVRLGADELLEGSLQNDLAISASFENEEEPPSSPDDVSLSKIGSLFLLTATIVNDTVGEARQDNNSSAVNVFPDQYHILSNTIGREEAGGLNTAGSEPLSLIDSVLALGLVAIHDNLIGEPDSDEVFTRYLQFITLISANTPEPNLRFYAHFLASTILRTHPSDQVRLAFIRDTLEHCPIENLKASAVSWIKGETLEAFAGSSSSVSAQPDSVFATPVALETLAVFLFPDITQELGSSDMLEKWTTFKSNLTFYLAALNFYYLLLAAPHLHGPLEIASLHTNNDIGGSMLGPLRQASAEFKESLKDGMLAEIENQEGIAFAQSDLAVLDDVLDRVEQGVVQLNNASAMES